MDNENTRHRVNEPDILAEEISGEVLAIDNRTGAYMSITGSGVPIWNLVAAGHTPAEVAEMLAAHHDANVDAVRTTVGAFVDRLSAVHLIVVADRAAPETPAAPAALSGDGSEPFSEPQLDIYTDMEELLLFDPIHDVGEAGWPEIAPEANPT